jgi:hypothetical protein
MRNVPGAVRNPGGKRKKDDVVDAFRKGYGNTQRQFTVGLPEEKEDPVELAEAENKYSAGDEAPPVVHRPAAPKTKAPNEADAEVEDKPKAKKSKSKKPKAKKPKPGPDSDDDRTCPTCPTCTIV